MQPDALKHLLVEGFTPLFCIPGGVLVFICAVCPCTLHTKCHVLGLSSVITHCPWKKNLKGWD